MSGVTLGRTGGRRGMPDFASLLAAVREADKVSDLYGRDVSVVFLRNFTIEGAEPFLKFHLHKSRIRPTIAFGKFDTIRQELMDGSSVVHTAKPEIVVLALMLPILDASYGNVGWRADVAIREVEGLFDLAARQTNALVVVNTFLPPSYRELGIAAAPRGDDFEGEVARLNVFVREYCRSHAAQFILVDWERLLRIVGEEAGIDRRYWYLSKAPFRQAFLNLYALEIAKVARALKGASRKCLVLDCDDTIWGGTIGEDGVDGIELDPNEWPGRAFYEFQRTVLQLAARGVLITLCSKNNEDDVWEVLERHPACLIKRAHLAAWRINWNDKANGISELAQSLNLGLDAFVFVDNSPTECELVRRFLPAVEVVQVPEKLYDYPNLLLEEGLFDTLSIGDEDRRRGQMYQEEAARNSEKERFASIDEYLATLELVAVIRDARPADFSRVAQLTQKTNQFNLTTRRYTEPEIASLAAGPDSAVFSLALRDRFGDFGLTGVLIARRRGRAGSIDSLLLSCRILGRKVELAFVEDVLLSLEQRWGIESWEADFIPTAKNGQVAGFWEQLGFEVAENDGGRKRYRCACKSRPRTGGLDFILRSQGD